MAKNPKYGLGQTVSCVMYAGLWSVSRIMKYESKRLEIFHRYTIRQGEVFIDDVVESWLSPARLARPELRVVGGNTSIRRFRASDHGAPPPSGGNAA